jgi:hypothetical protein
MTHDEFSKISDLIMLPVLKSMAPAERKKLLLALRQTVHPSAHAWIDAQLSKLRGFRV